MFQTPGHTNKAPHRTSLALMAMLLLAGSSRLIAETVVRPVQTQAPSSVSVTGSKEGEQAVEIQNVTYEVTGTAVPGRPQNERLLLRKTSHSKQVLGDKGIEAMVTLEAWPLGVDPKQKPLYTVKVTGETGQTIDNSLYVAARGLEEVEWWSVYKLGTGQYLFDTFVPLVSFSISRETAKTRYVGMEAPTDDSKDVRLKQAKVIGVVTYASEERVIREVLLTCDDPKQAPLLRSYADVSRKLTLNEKPSGGQTLTLVFSQNYPGPANPVEIVIPIVGDDLDAAHAQMPRQIQASVWRR
jgi:hypothetical protein